MNGEIPEPVGPRGERAAGRTGQPEGGTGPQLQDLAALRRPDAPRALQYDQEDVEHVLLVLTDLGARRQPHQIGVQLPPGLRQMPQRAAGARFGGGKEFIEDGEDPGSSVHGVQATRRRGWAAGGAAATQNSFPSGSPNTRN